jgi:hypothetical protein
MPPWAHSVFESQRERKAGDTAADDQVVAGRHDAASLLFSSRARQAPSPAIALTAPLIRTRSPPMAASYFDVDGTLVTTNLVHPTLFYMLQPADAAAQR